MSGSGTFETCRLRRAMSEFEGKAENICSYRVLLSLTQSGRRAFLRLTFILVVQTHILTTYRKVSA